MTTLQTKRLILRPLRKSDARVFALLAGDWAVASMTSDIPHPFSEAQAMAWIRPARGEVRFAIVRDGGLIGGVGFYRRPSGVAELGFWLGRPWWGRGFATEAAKAVLAYGAATRRLPGFSSAHFVDNPASARVLAKLGFEPTGRGLIACVARGHDVEAMTYRLDRRGVAANIPVPPFKAVTNSRWRTWLSRFAGGGPTPRTPTRNAS
jgi:RimJ/RimL family protein N-acetyltransferase